MKILLINPPRTYYPGSKNIRLGLPLGILYLAAVLEKNGHDPEILDCLISSSAQVRHTADKIIHGIPEQIILKKIRQTSPDVVGISNQFSAQIENVIYLANLIKKINQKIIVVVGGPHISIAGKKLISENKNIDFGVIGEGEYIFLKLIKSLEADLPFSNISSLIFRNAQGQTIANPFGGFIQNLDDLPLPAYNLIDMPKYFQLLSQGFKTRPNTTPRSISMITSRGCPYNCIFCSIHLHMGKRFRAHSPTYVIEHIKHLVEKYQISHISFEDDNFTLDVPRCKKILQAIIDNQLPITWDTPNGIRADNVDEELIALMKKSGCQELIFGIESGSQRVLDEIIDKKLKLSQALTAIKLCKKYKIKTKAFFVIGFPGETKKEIQQTIDLSLKLYKKYDVTSGLLLATPLLGTRLHQICQTHNYLVKEINPRSLATATQAHGQGLIATQEFTPAYLKQVAVIADKQRARLKLIKKLYRPTTYWDSLKFVCSHPQKTLHHLVKKIF